MNPLLDAIRDGWAWKGLEPVKVLRTNAFGNVLVRDTDDRIWRITPEDLDAAVVADSAEELDALLEDSWFQRDWEMAEQVDTALAHLGPVDDDTCYCLKIPSVLGGKYEADNLGTIPLAEHVSFAGDLARQIDGLPDGTPIEFKFIHTGEADADREP